MKINDVLNRFSNKVLALLLCVAILLATSMFGTLSYLTDREGVVNTFTVGMVDINVDEAKVNSDGTLVEGADRVKENTYHLLPGQTYTKDPTMTVKAGSEKSYVRMIMTVDHADAVQAIIDADDSGNNAVKDYADLFDGWVTDKWIYNGYIYDSTDKVIKFEFRYFEPVAGFDADGNKIDIELEPLFTSINVPGYVTAEQLAALNTGSELKITVEGHAIQVVGFEGQYPDAADSAKAAENAAWAAFDAQYPKTTGDD